MSGNTSRIFAIRNSPGCPGAIPANADVQAYSLNVTVVPHGKLRWLTVYPSAPTPPNVSTLNSYDGRTKANAAIIPAALFDANRPVSVYASDDTDVILDLNGYYVPASSNPTALAYYPVTPCRVADTRDASFPPNLGSPALGSGQVRNFPMLSSTCGLPADAQAYALNITAIPSAGAISYLNAWPTGQNQPAVSTLNATTGTVTANAAIVGAGTSGNVSVYSTAATNLIIDVSGYYAPPIPGGLALYTVPPCRALDSRTQANVDDATRNFQQVDVRQSCSLPARSQAFVLNATVIPVKPVAYLTLSPQAPFGFGDYEPTQSTLNAYDGAVTSNLAIVASSIGIIDASSESTDPGRYPFYAQTYTVLDLFGYFAP